MVLLVVASCEIYGARAFGSDMNQMPALPAHDISNRRSRLSPSLCLGSRRIESEPAVHSMFATPLEGLPDGAQGPSLMHATTAPETRIQRRFWESDACPWLCHFNWARHNVLLAGQMSLNRNDREGYKMRARISYTAPRPHHPPRPSPPPLHGTLQPTPSSPTRVPAFASFERGAGRALAR